MAGTGSLEAPGQVPTERERVVRALTLGLLLGTALALAARLRRPR